jgi:nucleoside 2-deoxyribosyltransferase
MEKKKVIYIAGPITGVDKYWEPFEKVEDELTARGFIVLTPTRLPYNLYNDKAMKICLAMIEQADAVFFLPGWHMSVGANLEMYYCKYCDKPYYTKLEDLVNPKGGSDWCQQLYP